MGVKEHVTKHHHHSIRLVDRERKCETSVRCRGGDDHGPTGLRCGIYENSDIKRKLTEAAVLHWIISWHVELSMTFAPPSLGVILGDLVRPGLDGDPNGYARCAMLAFGFTPRGRRSGPILILIYNNLLSTQLY